MPTYRAVIERTEVSHEVVEIKANNLRDAAVTLDQYSDSSEQKRLPRSLVVMQSYHQDRRRSVLRDVVKIEERS
jgi:hypothetical protein